MVFQFTHLYGVRDPYLRVLSIAWISLGFNEDKDDSFESRKIMFSVDKEWKENRESLDYNEGSTQIEKTQNFDILLATSILEFIASGLLIITTMFLSWLSYSEFAKFPVRPGTIKIYSTSKAEVPEVDLSPTSSGSYSDDVTVEL